MHAVGARVHAGNDVRVCNFHLVKLLAFTGRLKFIFHIGEWRLHSGFDNIATCIVANDELGALIPLTARKLVQNWEGLELACRDLLWGVGELGGSVAQDEVILGVVACGYRSTYK